MLKYCLIIVVVIIGLVFALQDEKRYLRCDGTLESNDSIRPYELFLDITKRSPLIFWFDHEVFEAIAIVGTPDEVVDAMKQRFTDVIGRTGFSVPSLSDEQHTALLNRLREE